VKTKSFGAQIIFSAILSAGGKGSARNRCIMNINSLLCGWCRHEGFGFYKNGIFFNDYKLLDRDETHLTRKSKGIFVSRQVSLVWWALKCRTWGVQGKVTKLKSSHLAGEQVWPIRAVTDIPQLCPKLRSKRPTAFRVDMDMADPFAPLQGNQHARVPP